MWPGCASIRKEYRGSRKERQRFQYDVNSTAGFIEMAPNRNPPHCEFMKFLKGAQNVERAEWKEAKRERNINVNVKGFKRPIEFQMITHQHMKHPTTVSADFKPPPIEVHRDAWHILLHVVKDKELLPEYVQDSARSAIERVASLRREKNHRAEEPGSASSDAKGGQDEPAVPPTAQAGEVQDARMVDEPRGGRAC